MKKKPQIQEHKENQKIKKLEPALEKINHIIERRHIPKRRKLRRRACIGISRTRSTKRLRRPINASSPSFSFGKENSHVESSNNGNNGGKLEGGRGGGEEASGDGSGDKAGH